MGTRTATYTAFYVSEPFSEYNLSAHATPDFLYYNQLRAWKGADSAFPFIDAHEKTYNVRDNSSWETLKRRLHYRLHLSKNIIFILSKNTKESRALREELDYGINILKLPVIVIYPDFKEKSDIVFLGSLRQQVKDMWKQVPIFRNSMENVAMLHIPYKKDLIARALRDDGLKVFSMDSPGVYYYAN